MKNRILLLIIAFAANICSSQTLIEMLEKPGTNFYDLQKKFNETWKDQDVHQKGKGYKQFKRWEYFMEPRVYPSGDMSLTSHNWEIYTDWLQKNSTDAIINNNNQIASTTWTAMGPFGPLTGNANNGLPRKAGRLSFITFHPSTPNTYWVGAPAGGLWKTTNNGTSWSTNTDNLPVIGCNDLAVDPTNPNVMYLATGDGYWQSSWSVGVLKSINGGTTWNATGLTFNVNQQRQIRKIIVNPTNTLIVMAATNVGIYRSVDGGTNWTPSNNLNTYDLEFNTAGTNTVYAAGLSFSISVDGGATFSQVSNGIPAGGGRTAIAVTTADPNYVYAVKATSTDILQGVYRSTNGGTTFSLMTNATRILSTNCFTDVANGQGNYDLGIAASPLNKNEVTVAGINVWQSLDGGNTFSNIGCAYGTGTPPFIHADHHDVEYTTTGTLYSVNDGGVYQYTGTQWNDLSNPMNIAQMYRLGLSSLSPNLWITGHQDNGTNYYNNGVYKAGMLGDGMTCFIDRTNDQNMFGAQFSGDLYNSPDGGVTWNSCVVGMAGPGAWVTPWKQDPVLANVFWAGKKQMYKSVNGAAFWTQAGTLPGVNAAQFIAEFAVAPSNNQIIYVSHGTTGIFKSIDGAATWTNVTGTIPAASAYISYITIDPANANNVWVTLSGYSAGNKVFKTTNGGTTWTNISYNLPNLPANCSVYELGNTNGRVYVGMDVGVYYIDNSSGSWTLYNTGLPNTPVFDLRISPVAPTKLRAATFGRGVYQVDIVPSATVPVSAFNYQGSNCGTPATLVCNDISTNSPNSWAWTVTPATGVTINTPTSPNPTITFNNVGTYTVSLTASNGFGTGSLFNKTVTISVNPTVNVSASSTVICLNQSVTLNASGANTYTWQPGGSTGTSVTYTPNITQVFTVTGSNAAGCSDMDTVTVNVSLCLGILPVTNGAIKFSVFPNPTNDKITVRMDVKQTADILFELTDVSGKLVLKQNVKFTNDKTDEQLNIGGYPSGAYFLKISSKEGSSQMIKIIKQ